MDQLPGFEPVFSRGMQTCGTSLGHRTRAGCCCAEKRYSDSDLLSLPGVLDPTSGGNGKYSWGSNCDACPLAGTRDYIDLCHH